jgi:isoquinoline 1-oxidoreductase subunit beta
MTMPQTLDRRAFLRNTAAGGTGLLVGFYLPAYADVDPAAQQEEKEPNPFNAWVHVSPENRVTLILAKSEMGQGVMTALPMILADELYLDWKNVSVQQAETDPEIYDLGTGGSSSVRESWLPLRQAGAAAREMLIAAAAKRWNVNPNTCHAKDGGVLHGSRQDYLTYGQLTEDAAKLPIPNFHKVPLKNPDDFTIIGHAIPRVDAAEKSTGKAEFGIDVRRPGMLFATLTQCPVFGGKLKTFDASKAKKVPGVRDVFAIDPVTVSPFSAGGVAVVAENTWAAMEGRKALEIQWDEGPNASQSSEGLHQQFVANAAKPGKVVRNDGDANTALAAAKKKIEAVYEFPFAPHATMEPMNCTVQILPNRAEAWVPSQAPQWAQDMIAKVAKLPHEKVVVHTTLMGGGFGRRAQGDFALQTAQVAAKTSGKPVMLLWTREDDMQHDFYRPASYNRLWGALDEKGNLLAWKHFQSSTSIQAVWHPNGEATAEKGEFGQAIFIPYSTPNFRVEYTLGKSAVPRAWWRSVESSSSGFVVETFVDELAHLAGEDPLAFRLRTIGSDRKIPNFENPKEGKPLDTARQKGVLKLAAEKAEWNKPLPNGVARGIAAFYSFDTYAACVAEVSFKDSKLKIHRLVYAVDVGRVVNPDGVRAQVESAAIYGLSAGLYDAITIKGGRVEQSNFNDYEMPRIPDAPVTEVHLIESKDAPTGIGEPGLPVVLPAVFNAFFALTGKRIRSFPVRPDDLA